jgi:hypothetical protein
VEDVYRLFGKEGLEFENETENSEKELQSMKGGGSCLEQRM